MHSSRAFSLFSVASVLQSTFRRHHSFFIARPPAAAMDAKYTGLFAEGASRGAVPPSASSSSLTDKVTIVGTGAVGMACAVAMLTRSLVGELVLSDIQRDRLRGEVLDLQHAGAFLTGKVTMCDEEYERSANSDICVICAGVRQQEGESRISLAERNVEVMRSIVPKLVAKSPNAILLVVSNPADIMTYITWKLSGLPINRVLGSGTYLDSSRFRNELANQLNISARSVHGWIIGEHGDSSVAVWSGVNVAGVPLKEHVDSGDQKGWETIHKSVVQAAYEVIKLKGYTNWAIGAAVASLVECILKDEKRVVPVSTAVQGLHGIEQEVFLSLPCVLDRSGVSRILKQHLTDDERGKLNESATKLWSVQSKLKFE